MSELKVEYVFLLACGSFNPITMMHLRLMEIVRDELTNGQSTPCNLHSSSDDLAASCPFTGSPSLQMVVGGIFSPVSDGYTKPGLAASQHRVELARLACSSTSDWLAVDCWEANQTEWSRTALVASHLQTRLEEVLARLDQPGALRQDRCCADDELLHDGVATDQWLVQRILSIDQLVVSHHLASRQTSQAAPRFCRVPRVRFVCGADLVRSFLTPGLWSDEDLLPLLAHYGVVCITRPGENIPEEKLVSRFKNNVVVVSELFENGLSSTAIRRALSNGRSVRYLVPEASLQRIHALGLYTTQQ